MFFYIFLYGKPGSTPVNIFNNKEENMVMMETGDDVGIKMRKVCSARDLVHLNGQKRIFRIKERNMVSAGCCQLGICFKKSTFPPH